MAGPNWSDDNPADLLRIEANCRELIHELRTAALQRPMPEVDDPRRWHAAIFRGCDGPVACYVGNFRGDPRFTALVDYEVGVGPLLADGLPEKVGVPSAQVAVQVSVFLQGVRAGLAVLDAAIPTGQRPRTVDSLAATVELIAEVHGEWVRLHPFANGNGRTARVWAAFIALRYGLPVFVRLRPRPDDVAYARAAIRSMGRPPGFIGDHRETVAVFAHLLSLSLLPS